MKGPNLAAMAWRNLWRNRRRTVITLSSIAFGILLAVLFTGLGDSRWAEVIDLAARMGGGHVTLLHPEYLDTPSLKRTVTAVESKRNLALADADVDKVITRISGQTMLATAGESYGVFFIAFDPGAEDESTLSVLEGLVEGKLFESGRDRGIILGKKLATNLGVRLGRKVVYTMTDKSGEIITGLGRVSGIVATGAPSVDAGLCLLPLDTIRDALGYAKDEATQVGVFLSDQRKADQVAARLGAALDDGSVAVTWRQSQPDLAGFISMKVAGMVFFEMLIMVLVAAGIFNTLFVSVMERVREFGILMAIGFSPWGLFRLVMWESFWLGMVGIVAAAIVTAGPYYLLTTKGLDMSGFIGESGAELAGVAVKPTLCADIYPENAVFIALAALIATLLSGLYPAWRAGRVVPVESIKLV